MPESNDSTARPADPLRRHWHAILTVRCGHCRHARRGAVSLWAQHHRLHPDQVTLSQVHRRLICGHCDTRWPSFDVRDELHDAGVDWKREYPSPLATVH
jgi:hypothetical protein